MNRNDTESLRDVYAAETTEEIASLYDGWASSYEADMARAGYRHPAMAMAMLARHLPRGEGPILDAGAGTGLVGEWLGIIGYPHVEALDISKGMLDVARKKNVYAALHEGALGGPLPLPDAHFAAVISTGVFTTGHVGGEALPGLIAVVRGGGFLVLTVKDSLWDGGFGGAVAESEAAGTVRIVETSESYLSLPGEVTSTPGRVVVLERL